MLFIRKRGGGEGLQMEISKTWIAITLTLCLLTGVSTYIFTQGPGYRHTQPNLQANVYVLKESLGQRQDLSTPNVICNIGGQYVRNALAFGNISGSGTNIINRTTCISMGNATVAATLTKLTTEATTANFTRVNASSTTVAWYNTTGNFYAFNVSYTFTASATLRLNAVGLHWDSTSDSDSNMFACAAITETTFNSGDTATLTWVITIGQS